MRKIVAILRQLLFPRRCPVCDEIVVPYGEKICPDCLPKLKLLTQPYCMKCGKKLFEEEEYCADCRRMEHAFARGRALYEYESVSDAIYRLKYTNRQEYAEFFGEEISFYLKEFIEKIQPDAILPVPLHKKRWNKRGYNQAELLGRAVGKQFGIPVLPKLVSRVKNTQPLKMMNPQERQNNLKNAFIINKNDVKLKVILVVDDIYTTGSTIDEISRVLLASGAEKVYFVALACGAGI